MDSEIQARVLACFVPALPDEAIPRVLEELDDIIDNYSKFWQKRIVIDPIKRIDENEAEYEKRCIEMACAPRRRGRPGYILQRMLLYRVRDLLGRNGCNYGSYFDGDSCPLFDLLALIHYQAGSPRGDVSWSSIAKKWGSPFHELRLALGNGLSLSGVSVSRVNSNLRRAMSLAYRKRT